jgi:hypothetical protein
MEANTTTNDESGAIASELAQALEGRQDDGTAIAVEDGGVEIYMTRGGREYCIKIAPSEEGAAAKRTLSSSYATDEQQAAALGKLMG